ncbi:3-methyl-2-oxobutanoate hydroxymethyltransferase [Isoalcanivorax pacificus W11-5]|uniref:3-methyl-2-oxobutanoate hydroxymethyltransferase n=1 Tax=Isoalcanivorax pacificus W11-5 TaxID=391936 RepID=A0A0B4XQY8_9GAMM|nr:3-methyl-2-oxobutanoate hydroxymethyltransferase [Isoalcanivorax pacificus]AJD49601.1 3-methyl-2-oxobutanoate hydroxymethyltransferase [Isoalcanivorax pacificus W11-5]
MSVTVRTLQQCKNDGRKISMLTAYDATFAHQISSAGVDAILIGDSLGMVMQGHDSTVPVSVDEIAYHTACVARGNHGALLIADVPFLAAATLERALDTSLKLMQAGANVVKIEGAGWLADTVRVLKRNGVPTCIHMGLTPQSVNAFGGYRVQGREQSQAEQMVEDARALEAAGADMLLLECVPRALSRRITESVGIPVIGIGAAPECDGQVLVIQDVLGITQGKTARFVKNFMAEAGGDIAAAIKAYDTAVKDGSFPAAEHCF